MAHHPLLTRRRVHVPLRFANLGMRLGRLVDRQLWKWRLARLWQTGGPRTRIKPTRYAQLAYFAQHVVDEGIAGDYAEFGVWRGGSMHLVANLWRGQHRALLGFDSFQGLPRPDPVRDGAGCVEHLFADVDVDEVRAFFRDQGLDDVELVQGWFEDTIDRVSDHRLALCHIDADLYESVKLALEATYDRVEPGGILLFDDYRHPECAGATIAVEEFFAHRPEQIQQWPGVDCSCFVQKGVS